jgi:hypothetical protein
LAGSRRLAACLLAGSIGLVLAAGCGARRGAPATPGPNNPPTPAPALIALLPDPETHVTGRIRVSNEFGAVDVSTPRASLKTVYNAAPGPLTTLGDDDVNRLFGAALAALPPAPRHYVLQFKFESDILTDASAALIPDILAAVKALAVPEVMIVGHTDTMGDNKSNLALGLKRANAVRSILMNAGLSSALIETTSHGEADLAVRTGNNVPEPRNRRVEITVR